MTTATINSVNGADLPATVFGLTPTIASVISSTASEYIFETDDAHIIRYFGTMVYDGAGDLAFGTEVSQMQFSVSGSGKPTDFSLIYDTPLTDTSRLVDTNGTFFWNEILDHTLTGTLRGDVIYDDTIETFVSNENFGFALNGYAGSQTSILEAGDTITIKGAGMFVGDTSVASDDNGGMDTLTLNRTAAKDTVVVGDNSVATFTSPIPIIETAGDTIIDISTNGGFTKLVGDIKSLESTQYLTAANVVAGDDTITAGTIGATLVGDVDYVYGLAVFTGGNDTLTGSTKADIIIGDFRLQENSFYVQNSNPILGGDDIIQGGDGADTIYGEYQSIESILVEGGDDTIHGGNGADEIYGQTGDDTIYGESGADTIEGGDGKDFLSGGNGIDTLLGGKDADEIEGGDKADTLKGGKGGDILSGENGGDTVFGGKGGDTLKGGKGDDTLDGDEGNDTLKGGEGSDALEGGEGSDELYGGAQTDTLLGGDGADDLFGDDGKDILNGGAGNDTLTGGSNADIFEFSDGFGDDVITDFNISSGSEVIDFTGLGTINGWIDLSSGGHMSMSGGDTIIDDLSGNTITLTGIDSADLTEDEFVF